MRSVLLIALLSLASGGCAQMFGLDNTSFVQKDAPTDAPSICDGAPLCSAFTGRSACGQIYGLGANANVPLRVAQPTGAFCDSGGTGPCALTIEGMALSEFFGTAATTTPAIIDDCGRYAVIDLDATIPDVAIVMSGPGVRRSATLELGRPMMTGQDRNVPLYVMTDAVATGWQTELGVTSAANLGAAYLVRFQETGGGLLPIALAKDGSPALSSPPGTPPWVAYFAGDVAFGTLDPARTTTGPTLTALAVLGAGAFSLEGVRAGARCKVPGLQQVVGTLIYVMPTGC